MNDIDRAIAMLRDDIALGRQDLKKLTRLAELLEERGHVFREEMEILRRFEAQPVERPKPPMLCPLGISEFVDGAWIIDEESWARRPR